MVYNSDFLLLIDGSSAYMTSGFETLNLHPQLKKAIDALGFTQMTPIQQKVLKYTLAGHDAIGRVFVVNRVP